MAQSDDGDVIIVGSSTPMAGVGMKRALVDLTEGNFDDHQVMPATKHRKKHAWEDLVPIDLDDDEPIAFPAPPADKGKWRATGPVVLLDDDDDDMDNAPWGSYNDVVAENNLPVKDLLDIFSDMDVDYARQLLRRRSLDATIAYILEHNDYPRSKGSSAPPPRHALTTSTATIFVGDEDEDGKPPAVASSSSSSGGAASSSSSAAPQAKSAASSSSSGAMDVSFQIQERNRKLEKKADEYRSSTAPTSDAYKQLAVHHLTLLFPNVNMASIRETFEKNSHRYFRTREAMRKIVYGALLDPTEACKVNKDKVIEDNIKKQGWTPMKKPRKAKSADLPGVNDHEFEEELKFIKEYEKVEQEKIDQAVAQKINEQEAEACHALIECGCCCGERAFEDMVSCTEGHLFCLDCLKNYAQTRLFEEGKTSLQCMSTMESCEGTFPDLYLQRALDDKVYQRYSEKLALEAVEKVDLPNLVTCPSCGFKAELDEEVTNFRCPNESCQKISCRLCGEDRHPGLKCDEVEKKQDVDVRRKIEEAMTAAKIRTCAKPGCKATFVKAEGCNKVTCAKCGTLNCYICRQLITAKVGYAHFCQTPLCTHGNCKKCPLWTKGDEEDNRAIAEAGKRAKEEAQKELGEESTEVKDVDVENLLKAGVPANRAGAGGGIGAAMADFPFPAFNLFGFAPFGAPAPPAPPAPPRLPPAAPYHHYHHHHHHHVHVPPHPPPPIPLPAPAPMVFPPPPPALAGGHIPPARELINRRMQHHRRRQG